MNEKYNNIELNAYGDSSKMSSSKVYDKGNNTNTETGSNILNKSLFYRTLNISLLVSVFFIFMIDNFVVALIFSSVGFFCTFVILSIVFFINQSHSKTLLSKSRKKKT